MGCGCAKRRQAMRQAAANAANGVKNFFQLPPLFLSPPRPPTPKTKPK